ncbi:MAG: hypothetical protein K2J00_08890, partial [Bacteroidaceae bacterium]|nr:hypothetical protein [Bacteroidaceae bacterium]
FPHTLPQGTAPARGGIYIRGRQEGDSQIAAPALCGTARYTRCASRMVREAHLPLCPLDVVCRVSL